MSRLGKKLKRVVSKGARLAGSIAPLVPQLAPFSGVIQGISGGGRTARPPMMASSMAAFPAVLPGLGAVTRAVLPGIGAAAGVAVRGARTIANSAMTYCRRHPAWCGTIGGVAAVEGLIRGGQLPPVKRRRARGITARELRNFKRVVRFTSKYCAPVQRARRAPALRSRKC